jgi:hypothetical protein
MTKTSKLQLNQPDATAGSSGPHHAKIIAAAQHGARLDARKREALDVGRWALDVGTAQRERIFRKLAASVLIRRHPTKPRKIRKIVLTFFRGVYKTRDVWGLCLRACMYEFYPLL